MQKAFVNPKHLVAIVTACSVGMAIQAQVIDPLNGTSSVSYTTTLVNDPSSGGGEGISFTEGSSGLQANYVGATLFNGEQAVYLANASAFSSTFAVGDTLYVDVAMPATGPAEDFGLAISATATPTAANAGNSYNSRPTFDWASISVRPSQNAIRVNTSISGTLTTSGGVIGIGTGGSANVSELFIQWVSADSFTLGYVLSGVQSTDETVTFNSGSAIGTAIGFYGDIRAVGGSLGNFTNLSIQPIPEPSTLALCGIGLAGMFKVLRRKKQDV